MECHNCGHINASQSHFCSQCGTNLVVSCPVCSTEANDGDQFCRNCGATLASGSPASSESDLARYVPEELLAKMRSARAGASMQGERRTVTMLFADIRGSTAAAEQLDPEDWADVINGAFEHLIAPVYRYEGTLARLAGDAVLAFFGAPIAHEDDPVRAVRAGLDIIEALDPYKAEVEKQWGILIDVRVGINTGLVVVGEVGSDLRVEYTALGDAINLAARMEQAAEPGTVQITSDTVELLGGAFDVEDLGTIEVKGKSEPIAVYRPLGFVGTSASQTMTGPFVGRDSELNQLRAAHSSVASGSGAIVSIIGEAGNGKSRLMAEFFASVGESTASTRSDDGDIVVMRGRTESYDVETPLSIIRDLLSGWIDVTEDGGFSSVMDAVSDAGIADPDAPALLAYLAGVAPEGSHANLIPALEAPVLQARALEVLSTYLGSLREERPVWLVFEDLHWGDATSLALVEALFGLAERAPIGIMLAMRPYRDEPAWRLHEVAERDYAHRYTRVDVGQLADSAGKALLDQLLAGRDIDAATMTRVLDRSGGNPLFLEEIVRTFDESGQAATEDIPTGISAMLTARLDRLDDESKLVAQLASVIGSRFDRDQLATLVPDFDPSHQMTDLLRRGIFVVSEGRGGGSLSFRHALMQDAAYSTVLRRTRRRLHRQVADDLIERHPDDAVDISRHLVEAGDASDAFPYLVSAGHAAIRSMALSDAIRSFTTALDNVPDDVAQGVVVGAHDGLGVAYSMVPNLSQTSAAYQRLMDYGESIELPTAKVTALNRLGMTAATLSADLGKANEYLEDARRLAESIDDVHGLTEYHMNACFVASMGGNIADAVAHDEATVELATTSGDENVILVGMVRRAVNYSTMLDVVKAGPAVEGALALATERGDAHSVGIVQALGSTMLQVLDHDIAGALETAEAAQSMLVRFGSFYGPMAQRQLGLLRYFMGDIDGAVAGYVEARRMAADSQQGFVDGAAAAGLAFVYASLGLFDDANDLRATVVEKLGGPLGELLASGAWADLGFVNLLQERADEAQADLLTALDMPSTSRYFDRPRILSGLALASLQKGDATGAHERLDEARGYIDERNLHGLAGIVHGAAGRVHLATGDPEAAGREFEALAADVDGAGMLGVSIAAHTGLFAVATALADTDRAASEEQIVRARIDEVAARMVDESLRSAFVSNARKPFEVTNTI